MSAGLPRCAVPAAAGAAARPGARGEEAEAARGSCHSASPPSVTPNLPASDWLPLATAPCSPTSYWSSSENSLRSANQSAMPAQPPPSKSRPLPAPLRAASLRPELRSVVPSRGRCRRPQTLPTPRHPRAQPERLGFRNDLEIRLIGLSGQCMPVSAGKEFVLPQRNHDRAGLTLHRICIPSPHRNGPALWNPVTSAESIHSCTTPSCSLSLETA